MKTPIGIAKIEGDENGIYSVSVLNDTSTEVEQIQSETTNLSVPECLQACVSQLKEYFNGTRKNFNLKLNPQGTKFQQSVWKELQQIPFGKTTTYSGQSKKLGNLKAIRAVASANGKNPIWIIIPCHRVIGSDGSLTGYAGGIWRKKWLLEHEGGIRQLTLF